MCMNYLLENFKNNEEIKIWDPFVGCGTIILEFFSYFLNIPIRE